MVDTDKVAQGRLDEIDELREQTDALLKQSAKLIAHVEALLEKSRQLHLVNDALIKQRQGQKKTT